MPCDWERRPIAVGDRQQFALTEGLGQRSIPEDLLQAHAYAYGGAIIQDLGYYPFGSQFFSDLTHYVRSGDFVFALIEESKDLNEYAFALGALSHYAADGSGHELATNRAVAIMYPGLAKKYGPVVTYQEKPSAHMKVEYGFDVDQVAEGNYAPKAYHDFIGFEVSKPVLERAFARTYSLEMSRRFFQPGSFHRQLSPCCFNCYSTNDKSGVASEER